MLMNKTLLPENASMTEPNLPPKQKTLQFG